MTRFRTPDFAEQLQAEDPLAETGWQTLRRYGREIVGDAMWWATPWLWLGGITLCLLAVFIP